MRIETISTGDEVLTGRIVTINFGSISQKLEPRPRTSSPRPTRRSGLGWRISSVDATGRSRPTTGSSPPRQIIDNRDCRRIALNRTRGGRDARR